MEVSIIIPVYNAAKFITKAVQSALEQPEAKEILLIEDGSHDDSYIVCQGLSCAYDKIKLLSHPNKENRGASASRNLGIRHAICDYIAFLDADDFYLPNRFSTDQIKFKDPLVEGIYGATGFHIYDHLSDKLYQEKGYQTEKSTTVSTITPPSELPYLLLGCPLRRGQDGYFMLDALTVRRSVFQKTKYFNPELRVHQDTEWMIRLAITCRIETGLYSQPIAMRGIHEHNRIVKIDNEYSTRHLMYATLLSWANTHNTKPRILQLIKQNEAVYQLLSRGAPVTPGQKWLYFLKHLNLFWNPNIFRLLMLDGNGKSSFFLEPFSLRLILLAQRLLMNIRRRIYAISKRIK